MDAAKRRELEARRRALRARQEIPDHRRVNGSVVPKLRKGGVRHEMFRRGEEPSWLPRYLPSNSGRILWEAAPEPAQWERCFTPNDRLACIERLLREKSSADDLLLFVYGAPEESVRLRQADALPHLQILCAPLSTIWITSPPQAWLIELQDYDVRLAVPAEPTPEEAAVVELRRSAILAPITEALEAGGIEYEVYCSATIWMRTARQSG